MQFDKSRVYTALNADELKVGSKCVFDVTIQGLRRKAQNDDGIYVCKLTNLREDDCIERFISEENISYIYAYLIEPPKEKILELIAELEEFTTVVQKKNLRRLLK